MTGTEFLFFISTICALGALALSVTTPTKSVKMDYGKTTFIDHDAEDAEIISEKLDIKR